MLQTENGKRFTPEEAMTYLSALLPVKGLEYYQGHTVIHFQDGTHRILANAPIDWPQNQQPSSDQSGDYSETVEKTVQAWELDRQDRIELVHQAIEFAGVMNYRHIANAQSSLPKEVEYSQVEQATYESALKLMKREFDKGARKTESHLVRSETEIAGR
jgi:hypothetical protein